MHSNTAGALGALRALAAGADFARDPAGASAALGLVAGLAKALRPQLLTFARRPPAALPADALPEARTLTLSQISDDLRSQSHGSGSASLLSPALVCQRASTRPGAHRVAGAQPCRGCQGGDGAELCKHSQWVDNPVLPELTLPLLSVHSPQMHQPRGLIRWGCAITCRRARRCQKS